jgi:hypothetical protein
MRLVAITATIWVVALCAVAGLALLFIVLAPWPRSRAESRRLDPDVETRLLLREDPEEIAEDLEARGDDGVARLPQPPG